ncbi:MAG TPA: hypothetical protein VJB08_06260 [Candidatus Nanoarchaeia archaeon]|nr:hypothetical protein [Candidatus Nanoarchaeia archaeon]
MTLENLRACFASALRDEKKWKKHKGLLAIKPSLKEAEGYITKAKKNLELCTLYKEQGFDYKLPEEWFYTLYYCALAILSKFGVESRNQRCTALFLEYVKDQSIISYDPDFIKRITVYREKEGQSDVDEREKARYSTSIEIKEIEQNYDKMMAICKEAISQCKDIVFSEGTLKVPEELLKGDKG